MVKEKIYDFGLLGKWSESTMLEHEEIYCERQCTEVEPIFNKYTDIREELLTDKNEFENVMLKKLSLSEMAEAVDDYNQAKIKFEELISDYKKYRLVFSKLLKRRNNLPRTSK